MKKTIFLDAGHSLTQPGAVTPYGKEADYNMAVRNELITLLKQQGFEIFSVPDDLNLADSIKWVNNIGKIIDDGLSLSIHCNAGGGEGAETFYYVGFNSSKTIAEKLINKYCEELKIKNRGAKPDTLSAAGRLGWIRDTNTWACLIEIGFLDNFSDVQKIKDYKKVALGICKGICEIYGIVYQEQSKNNESDESIKYELLTHIQETLKNLEVLIRQIWEKMKTL